MIITNYRIQCDKCKRLFARSFNTKESLEAAIKEHGWLYLDGIKEDWCSDCINHHNATCKPGEEI